ncbi:rod shape-determining protein MreD [Sporolactobacillus terrae]|uniref:Rod shape-determining protein MreD n=1 Tax=Sporolactobacillus terrae TaxID=269673 RepID=A0A410DA23_9BACL|nr:rod shape-determining protein MreD [Sporolactobacillus terrae]QAA22926.1 rod shape-determining protein MreD [Sporolactobacillus terrae]QAA25899.1 rod shape-determining protein MreD [Sporolactobacillus terrae]UAK17774.1 rod shape-determining protein MreD [Sporolactobacillus terrae]BBN99323.1 hypothetical protein St703_20280 [Sporolactobacillus terrae]
MKQSKIFFLLFFLFIIQGTVIPLISLFHAWDNVQWVPEFVFVAILMIAFFGSLSWGMRYALVFGFMTDIVYSSVLGVYAFSLTLTVYLISMISRWVNLNLVMTLLLVAVGVVVMEFQVYVIYLMIGLTDQNLSVFFQARVPATLALNALFTLLIYYPFRRDLVKMSDWIKK